MPEAKFLLDADMPRSSAEVFRSFGFDVEDVRDIGLCSARDKEIIEYALSNGRIIVTRDTDFGAILRYPDHPGSIILRLPSIYMTVEINRRLEEFLGSVTEDEITNAIVVVELARYRRRSLV
jgi:predicted nuclease of predicted toxin-antitoxin system